MASTTDPRAAAFNATQFRDAIKFSMNMGLPETESERATFRWETERTWTISDSGGEPFDIHSDPATVVEHEDVQIDVAVEFANVRGSDDSTAIGEFTAGRALITVLDEDMPSIEGADTVLLGGNTYDIKFIRPPLGLFDVTIYQLDCEARDET